MEHIHGSITHHMISSPGVGLSSQKQIIHQIAPEMEREPVMVRDRVGDPDITTQSLIPASALVEADRGG